MKVALIIAQLLVLPGWHHAYELEAAERCSDSFLADYAVANPIEPSDRLAAAAFQKCVDTWQFYAEALASDQAPEARRLREMRTILDNKPYSADVMLKEARQSYIQGASIKVIEIRTNARKAAQ